MKGSVAEKTTGKLQCHGGRQWGAGGAPPNCGKIKFSARGVVHLLHHSEVGLIISASST